MKNYVWHYSAQCDYRCDYCYHSVDGWENLQRCQGKLRTAEECCRAWEAVHAAQGRCRIQLAGGEPFLEPGFINMMAGVSRLHAMHITTSLSQPVDRFIASVDPRQIEINATYHPRYADIVVFAERVEQLRGAGFSCGACYLAHPLQMREMLNYKKFLLARGIPLAIAAFRGMHEGKKYPEAYTPQERQWYRRVVCWYSAKDDRCAPSASYQGDLAEEHQLRDLEERIEGRESSICINFDGSLPDGTNIFLPNELPGVSE